MSSHISVLFSDCNDIWGSLSDMLWAQQTAVLISRHPLSSVEEIVSLFCPQCLARYSEEEATASLGRCPVCKECSHCFSAMVTDASSCGFCLAQFQPQYEDLHNIVLEQQGHLFKVLLTNLKSASSGAEQKHLDPSIRKRDYGVWQMEELKKKLAESSEPTSLNTQANFMVAKTSLEKVEAAIVVAGLEESSVLPVALRGVRLRSKRALRSKQDSRTGRMNILVQPKTLPLEGDSSLKLQKGKWWVKDSSAIHELPFVSVVSFPHKTTLLEKSGPCFIELCITNPKMTEVRIFFTSDRLNKAFTPYLRLDRLGATHVVHTGNSLRASTRLLSQALPTGEDEAQCLELLIGGFEDELLKDMDDSAEKGKDGPSLVEGSNDNLADDTITGDPCASGAELMALEAPDTVTAPSWTHRIVHNKAFVKIPVSLLEYSSSPHFELHLFCRADLGNDTIIELPFKVLFADLSK